MQRGKNWTLLKKEQFSASFYIWYISYKLLKLPKFFAYSLFLYALILHQHEEKYARKRKKTVHTIF